MNEIPSISAWREIHSGLIDSTWTVIGKGPGFHRVKTAHDGPSVGINHVWEKIDPSWPLTALHAFDLDVIESLTEDSLLRFESLWIPDTLNLAPKIGSSENVIHLKDRKTSAQRLAKNPIIERLVDEGRIFTYARGKRDSPLGMFPVRLGAFSGSTLVALLASLGVRKLELAGIDGGTEYSSEFKHLEDSTRLNGGQSTYDEQLQEIASIRRSLKLQISEVGESPLRVFVGTTAGQRLAFELLKYSIDIHSSRTVEVIALDEAIAAKGLEIVELETHLTGKTPFSFQRYLIPDLSERKGLSVYLDSDMLVFSDIHKLRSFRPQQGCANAVLVDKGWSRAPQLSVMLIDCERAPWSIAQLKHASKTMSYEELTSKSPTPELVERTIPSQWNSLEYFKKHSTCLLHYTNMPAQPWLANNNPLACIWFQELFRAVDDTDIAATLVASEVNAGNIRPGVLEQLKRRLDDPMSLPRKLIAIDNQFLPPHTMMNYPRLGSALGMGKGMPTYWQTTSRRMMGTARHHLIKSKAFSLARVFVIKLRKTVSLVLRIYQSLLSSTTVRKNHDQH